MHGALDLGIPYGLAVSSSSCIARTKYPEYHHCHASDGVDVKLQDWGRHQNQGLGLKPDKLPL